MWVKKEDRDGKVHDMTCNHQCSRCGSCCGLFIPFTEKELSVIKQYVRLHKIEPANRVDIMTGDFKAHCCFYNEKEKKCMVYPVRPYACRDFKCDRKDWEKYRDKYELRAKYNSSLTKKTIMGSFDDLIYQDYEPILRYLLSMIPVNENRGVESDHIIMLLSQVNRLDLLEHISVYDEKGNKIKGTDLKGVK